MKAVHNDKLYAKLHKEISVRKSAQEALKHSTERFETILKNVADGITVQDRSGKIVYVNDVGAKMCGFDSAVQMQKASINAFKAAIDKFELFDQNENKISLESLPGRQALAGEYPTPTTVLYRNKIDGSRRWSLIKARPVFDKHNKVEYAVIIFTDITETKELEKQKSQFISKISHEIKTPLTTIEAFMQLLERHTRASKDIPSKKIVVKVNLQLSKLNQLVDSLLDISRINSKSFALKTETFNIYTLIDYCIRDIKLLYPKSIIKNQCKKQLLVIADTQSISWVVFNLLTNAVKFGRNKEIVVKSEIHNNKAIISVKDKGIGIPSSEQANVFERFYRNISDLHQTFPGLGLGLYIASEILKMQGEKISFISKENVGSTFSFTVTLAKNI
ncbi:MAG TPA: PAS domain-containing sensor histidine kinase [Candidatus Saccharimonadales bacterium]|nr:PAS domain-containing sensor histidine kinase [Candidatus Saccharimonadales bacterium]